MADPKLERSRKRTKSLAKKAVGSVSLEGKGRSTRKIVNKSKPNKLKNVTDAQIIDALIEHDGNLTKTAKYFGVSLQTMIHHRDRIEKTLKVEKRDREEIMRQFREIGGESWDEFRQKQTLLTMTAARLLQVHRAITAAEAEFRNSKGVMAFKMAALAPLYREYRELVGLCAKLKEFEYKESQGAIFYQAIFKTLHKVGGDDLVATFMAELETAGIYVGTVTVVPENISVETVEEKADTPKEEITVTEEGSKG